MRRRGSPGVLVRRGVQALALALGACLAIPLAAPVAVASSVPTTAAATSTTAPTPTAPTQAATPTTRADTAAAGLMSRYQASSGLFSAQTGFDFAAWWTSAVALRSIIEHATLTHDTEYRWAIANTYDKNVAGGNWGTGQFRNEYIDDTGWWAMAWVDAYTLTGEQRYLDTARAAADWMAESWTDDVCGGGVLWSTEGRYRSAISNDLYLEVNAALHRAIPGDIVYLARAVQEWRWFRGAGLFDADGLVMDGRDAVDGGAACETRTAKYTYNQGQLIAGLVGLYLATSPSSDTGEDPAAAVLTPSERAELLATARGVADAMTTTGILNRPATVLGASTQVLMDTCEAGRDPVGGGSACGGDGPAFKGPAVRGLAALDRLLADHPYSAYLHRQATAAETAARTADGLYGLRWFPGSSDPAASATPKTQGAALALFDAVLTLPARRVTATAAPLLPSGAVWYRRPVTVTLVAPPSDPHAALELAVDGGPWQRGTSAHLEDGVHTVLARVVDTPSAAVPETVLHLAVDATAPTVTATVDPQQRTVSLEARDEGSGLRRTEYRVGDEPWQQYTGPVTFLADGGTLEYRASDVAGNTSETATVVVGRWAPPAAPGTDPQPGGGGPGTGGVVDPTVVGRVRSTVTLSPRPRHLGTRSKPAARRLRVVVRSSAGRPLRGKVVITLRAKKLRAKKLHAKNAGKTVVLHRKARAYSGRKVLKVAHRALPSPGTYRVRVVYRGSSTVAPSRTAVTLCVR